jgi:hypothetical protein
MLQIISERKQMTWRSGDIFLYGFVLYLFAVQTVYAYVYFHSLQLHTNTPLQIVLRLCTWTLPVVIYLVYSKQNIFEYLKLRRNLIRGVIWGLIVGAILVSINLTGTQLLNGHMRINLEIGRGLWWKAVILVGFSEEVVFRGFLLQEFAKRTRFWIANLAQATLFFIVHCPGWMLQGQFTISGIFHVGGYVFLVGLLMGAVWKKSNSLWSCMLLHSISNLCSFAVH